tara:strand:+ start:2717 stop:2887 length:171 start_codon:yes stop_codon:yes gene_type:complete
MKYLKLVIKYSLLVPIAFIVDLIGLTLKAFSTVLEVTEAYASKLFDKALAWCNDVN